jgi:pyrroloquinoline quinone (PQQ) biosynthesis protein C
MTFFSRLTAATRSDRESLVAIPVIQDCLGGRVSLPSYAAFLEQAYHHVRHTVPLLRLCRARLPERLAWMRTDLDEYIAEEDGHDQWILHDLSTCGTDPREVAAGRPGFATEVMVAYAYDTIERRNPLGFLGMVHVLEGTSVALALQAAERIQQCLKLPDEAFSYLRSHGILDRQHTAHFAALMDRIEDPLDQAAIIHAVAMFYRLYGNLFRSLPRPLPCMQPEGAPA